MPADAHIEAGPNASPKSQASGLSSSSSSSEDAHSAEDRRRSQYHDIGYLKSLAQSQSGAAAGQVKIVDGAEARHLLGQYQNDALFRSTSGPLVIARSAVTGTGRRIVDYARTWRGDTKAHRNKGPRKDFLAGEFKRAEDIQKFYAQHLATNIPDEQAAEQDHQLTRALSALDKDYRRLSATGDTITPDKTSPPKHELTLTPPDSHSPRHSPSRHSESLPSGHRKSSRENNKPPELSVTFHLPPPSSATASVQSIPRLGPFSGITAHDSPLRVANPDPNSPTVDSSSSVYGGKALTIIVLDDDNDYRDWELKHPVFVVRRTPTARKSRWDGALDTSHTRSESHGHSDTSSEHRVESATSSPHSRNITPPNPSTPPQMGHSPLRISPANSMYPQANYALGSSYVTKAPAYTPQSIYAPPQPQASPYLYSPFASPASLATPQNVNMMYPYSPYVASQAALSPYGSPVSPYGSQATLASPHYQYMGL